VTEGAKAAFFSYCREDSEFALKLAGDLKTAGANVWLDQLDIAYGQRWDNAVEDALKNCSRLVVLLSPASVDSTNVMDEVSFALEEKKTVIPVIYRDCALPFRLRRVHHVDFRQDYARSLRDLIRTLAPSQGAGRGSSQPSEVDSYESQSSTDQAQYENAPGNAVIKAKGPADRADRSQTADEFQPTLTKSPPVQNNEPKPQSLLPDGETAHPLGLEGKVEDNRASQASRTAQDFCSRRDPRNEVQQRIPRWIWAATSLLTLATVIGVVWAQALRRSNERKAVALYDQKRYSEAASPLDQSCSDGSAEACKDLGLMYESGNGVAKDEPRAVKLYRTACNAHYAKGCNDLGNMYLDGRGVVKDAPRAIELYSEACNTGEPMGCSNLGNVYANGWDVPKDEPRAVELYTEACNAGNADGCFNLGNMYADALGVAKDEPRAVELYTEACNAGNADGCFNLGNMYADALGVAKDEPRAVELFTNACNAGVADGCFNLGNMYAGARGVAKDEAHAVELYRKACDAGQADSCTNLGTMYQLARGVSQDLPQAATLYRRACDAGSAEGCSDLGNMYIVGTEKDLYKARQYLSKGCSMGNQWGCDQLKALDRGLAAVP
jgi:uncharacterized protein